MKATHTIRLLAIILSLLMIASLFVACNKISDTPSATDPGTEPGTDPSDPPVDRPAPDFSVPQNASVYSGTPDISWYTGDKTEYVLTTAEQFAGFLELRQSSKLYRKGGRVLGKDIGQLKLP